MAATKIQVAHRPASPAEPVADSDANQPENRQRRECLPAALSDEIDVGFTRERTASSIWHEQELGAGAVQEWRSAVVPFSKTAAAMPPPATSPPADNNRAIGMISAVRCTDVRSKNLRRSTESRGQSCSAPSRRAKLAEIGVGDATSDALFESEVDGGENLRWSGPGPRAGCAGCRVGE